MTKNTEEKNLPQFGIVKQFLKDMSFECPNSNLNVDESKSETEISLGIETNKLDENHFEVCLLVNSKTGTKESLVSVAEIKYAGVFVAKNLPDEQLEMLLGIEAPQLLFPFARGVLMRVMSESGCKVPNIEPVNFAHLFMQAKQQQQEAPEEQKKIEDKNLN